MCCKDFEECLCSGLNEDLSGSFNLILVADFKQNTLFVGQLHHFSLLSALQGTSASIIIDPYPVPQPMTDCSLP
jgi:hypothetical protein